MKNFFQPSIAKKLYLLLLLVLLALAMAIGGRQLGLSEVVLYPLLTVLIITIFIFVYLFGRSVSLNLGQIIAGMKEIAGGNFSQIYTSNRRDELGQIAHYFNEMTGSLCLAKAASEKQKDDLLRANQELDRFASIISHDLKAPARRILGFSEHLLQRELSDADKFYLQKIKLTSERMKELIDVLVQYARFSDVKEKPTRLDLQDIVAKVLEDLEGIIREQSACLKVSLAELPPLSGYPVHVRRLFENILSNSLKYAASGRTPEIEITHRVNGSQLEIYCRDNGLGIDKETLPYVFDPFHRGAHHEIEGAGIGLSICYKIMEWHRGQILIENNQGTRGCTVILRFPISSLSS